MDYLAVPEAQRARVVHEKARARRRGELHWLRSYLTDVLDDDDLARESHVTRLLAIVFPHLAARNGWIVPDDPRRIGGVLMIRPQDVKRSISRLVELGRIERISTSDRLEDGSLQLRLDADRPPAIRQPTSSQTRAGTEPDPSQTRAGNEPQQAGSLNGPASDPQAASRALAQSRAEQRRENVVGKATAYGPSERDALPDDRRGSNEELVNRIIAHAARGDQRSASIIRHEAETLPEFILARTLEALLARRPRPANPAGYVVATLRRLAAEHGRGREHATIQQEPEL